MDTQKIKVGIYVAGANIKIIGEHDLIENTFGHRQAGIYLVAVSMIRDPREPLTQSDIDAAIQTMKNNFQNNYFSFKAKDRAEADAFIKHHTNEGWTVIRELSEI